ncbi:MAG: HEAT repeat domain-containing protein [Verrucomicrobia bacterium]|nr:HEAT repeat domain-containing protein [Verrucomicrobiota bacterium]
MRIALDRGGVVLFLSVVVLWAGATAAPGNGDPAALRADALDTLADLVLSDEPLDPAVRNAAVMLLGEYGGAQHTAVLLQRLDASTSNEEKVAVVRALGRLGDTTAFPTLHALFTAPGVHRTTEDLAWSVPDAAAHALVELGDKGIDDVLEGLGGMDAQVRRRALHVIAHSGDLATVERLAPLAKDADRWVRLDVAEMLGTLGDATAVPALKPLLTDGDADVRLAAARSLARLGDAGGAKQLERAAHIETERALALRLLARLEPQQHLEALLDHMKDDVSEAELDDVAALLAACEPDDVVPRLLAACSDDDADLRAHAAAVLGRLRALDAVETLVTLLKDPSWDVRRDAAGALGRIGSKAARPGLESLAQQLKLRVRDASSAPAREACAVALVRLGDPDSAAPMCVFHVGERPSLAVSPEVAALVDGETIERALLGAIRQPDQGQPIERLLNDLHALGLTGSRAGGLAIEDLLHSRPYATMLAVNVPEVWAGLLDALGACAGPAAARTAAIYADDEIPLVRMAACRAILRLTSIEEQKGD